MIRIIEVTRCGLSPEVSQRKQAALTRSQEVKKEYEKTYISNTMSRRTGRILSSFFGR